MVPSKRLSFFGITFLLVFLFALPAFATWQSTPVQSVSFKNTIPQNAIVVDTNYVYVAAHDGHRLVVYRWNLSTTAEKLNAVWLIDGNLVSGVAGAYPSMALYDYGGYKYVLLSYIANGKLKVALFDPKDGNWYVKDVSGDMGVSLTDPRYTSISVGYATSAFTNGATVAAIAVGGESGVWVATVNMGQVAGSATETAFKSNSNWEVSRVTSAPSTGVDVFVTPQNFDDKWAGVMFLSYLDSGGLKLAVSKDGASWRIAPVDTVAGGDTSLWVGYAQTSSPATGAIAIAYTTTGGLVKFATFATQTSWDIASNLATEATASSLFVKHTAVSGGANYNNIDMAIEGFATSATVAIAYALSAGGFNVAYATEADITGAFTFTQKQVDPKGYGAITLVYSSSYYVSWATSVDALKLATSSVPSSWATESYRTLADASLFGMGLSVASAGGYYYAAFYDSVLRTLGYLELDSDYDVIGDILKYYGSGSSWLIEKKGDAYEVKVTNALDAGWNTDIAVRPAGNPHIAFTALLFSSDNTPSYSSLDKAVSLASPATVAYAT
ncbi:MAG: hypothetical protein H5T91_09425, partial [Synergistetes bacterium]|nr:hypothetical protein [Synergistota bacterium]